MPHRYKQLANILLPYVKLRPFAALREVLKEGYSFADFRADTMAGIVVALIAIPLAMALSVASGAPPQHGLYTVIIAGAVVGLLGGSRFQVTGPTAAFVVILAPIEYKFGLGGLLIAGVMAGIILLGMGLARMGRLIQFIPYPVTTGFTAGIAVVIAVLQLKDFFGLQVAEMPERFLEKTAALAHAAPTASWPEFFMGAFTLLILAFWPKLTKKIPAPLIALTAATLLATWVKTHYPELSISTIGSRFPGGIPQLPPHLDFPSVFGDAKGAPFNFSLETFEALVPAAFAIALLGAIESLLSAVVADGMAHSTHDPDAELVALGIGNILCPFFGGIAATGAIARTSTNVRFGAKSPISAVVHALFTLAVVLLFAPYVSLLPMAALAALLLVVAYNMSELKHFFHITRVAPRSDVTVLLICFFLTVIFDMVVGVSVGVVLAALLFMRRMAAVTSLQQLTLERHHHLKDKIPDDVLLYEIAGPLFFGATQKAMAAVTDVSEKIRKVIFLMDEVPVMDVTGLVAFESAIKTLIDTKHQVFLVGVQSQPLELLNKSELDLTGKNISVYQTLAEALGIAPTLASPSPEPQTP